MNHGELNRLAILAALNKASNHGYALHDQFEKEGFWEINTGGMYRLLRTLAEEDLIESYWSTPEKGPARRIYEITPDGRDYIASRHKMLHDYVMQVKRILNQIPRS